MSEYKARMLQVLMTPEAYTRWRDKNDTKNLIYEHTWSTKREWPGHMRPPGPPRTRPKCKPRPKQSPAGGGSSKGPKPV